MNASDEIAMKLAAELSLDLLKSGGIWMLRKTPTGKLLWHGPVIEMIAFMNGVRFGREGHFE